MIHKFQDMNKINILFTLCLIWIASVQINAQALSFSFAPSTITAAVGDDIDVEVRVGNGFEDLIGVQFGINYNGAALEFLSVDDSMNPLSDYSVAKRPNKSELLNLWLIFGSNSVTLAPGTLLYTAKFKVLSDIGNSIDILCGGDEFLCEITYADLSRSDDLVVDQLANINGGGAAQNEGPIVVELSNSQAATGSQSCVQFAVSDFVDILSTQFSVQYDETVLSFAGTLQNLDNCPDDPPSSVSNPLCLEEGNFNLFAPGTLTFSFSDFGSSNSFTLPDGTVILDICFDVIGAGGTSSDITIDDDPTFIQVIKQGEGNENFGITSNVGSITVTGSGGPLDVVSYSIGNSGGDAGTNVCVPVTVDEGFDDILGFGWSVDFDPAILNYTGIQNVNSAISSLSGNEAATGNLSFIWNAPFMANAEVSLPNGTVLYDMCFDVIGNSGQMSPLTFSSIPNPIETVKIDGPDADSEQDLTIVNTTNGSITVTNSEGFNLIVCEVDACPSDEVCVPILATGATGIASMSFTLEYDTDVLDYTGYSAVNNIQANEPSSNEGHITVIYISLTGADLNLENCEQLGEFCFDVIGAQGTSSAVSITSDPTEFAAVVAEDGSAGEEIPVAATNGSVNVDCGGTPGAPIVTCVCGAAELSIDESASLLSDVTCNGDQDGAITLFVSGGETPLTYSWSNGASTKDISDLGPGSYTVDVTDNGGAMASATFQITEPTSIQPNSSATNTTAGSSNDGTISLNVTGGTPSYEYLWAGGETTASLTGLAPATYNVTITDANDCTVVTSRTVGTNLTIGPIGGPGSPAGTTIITDTPCFGENTGGVALALSGGVAPYSINWNTGSNQANLMGLAAGNYCVTVVDTNGESVDQCFDVAGPAASLDINIAGQNPQSIPGANDGSLDIDVVGGDAPYTYSWTGPNVNGASTQDLSGLTEGTYVINVTDSRGCVRSRTIQVETAGEALAINGGATQVARISCFGEMDGSINPSVTGGATPYSYSWSGPNGFAANTANISGLAFGSYQLTVTDAVGAIAESVLFLIDQPQAPLSISAQITSESSPGQNDGGIDLTVSGGTPGYSFAWSNNNFNEDNFALTMGTYTVTVTDSQGCTIIESYQVLFDADPLVINATGSTVNNVRCFGDFNGSISPVVNGGVEPYSYNWGFSTDKDISGLSAGEYTLTVSDAGGQTDIQTFLVQSPPQLSIGLDQIERETANGNDGAIFISVSGGTPNYTFSWTGPNGFTSTSEDITGLAEGTYNLTVIDENGCTASRIISLGAFLNIENKFEIDVDCFGECTGEIDIVVQGGQPPYLYSWAGPNGFAASTQDINDLCAGVYTATISDAQGQQVFSTCRIDEPLLALSIGANPVIIDEVVPNNGSINITVNGGTPPYAYQWSNQEMSEDLTNLKAGSYKVTVTDNNGCIVISPDYEVDRIPLPLNVESLIENDPTCNGDCNGSVSMQIQGGDAPYSLVWSDGETQTLSTANPSYSRDDICAGNYILSITDANGQEEDVTIDLEDLAAIIIDADLMHETAGNDGAINTTVTGGMAPYSYEWSPSNLPSTPDQENLSAGLHIVTVTDANECTAIASFVILNNIGPLTISETVNITQIQCFGDENGSIDITVTGGVMPYTFNWSDAQNTEDAIGLGAGTYSVTVTDANGTTQVGGTYELDAPSEIIAEINKRSNASDDMTCDGIAEVEQLSGGQAPYTFLWSSSEENTNPAVALCDGPQSVIITDALGCSLVKEFILEIGELVALSAVTTADNVDCNGDATGAIIGQGLGGFAPYTYRWSTGDETQNIGGLLAGTYFLTVTDEEGTEFVTPPIVISEPNALNVDFTVVPESGMLTGDGCATAMPSGGTAPYTYQWNNPGGGGCNTAECCDLTAGTYFVVVKDAKECFAVDSVVVSNQFGGECMETRNIITPDKDGKNDSFLIQCAPGSINTLEIYNRWGQLVFLADNYDNTWEGTNRKGQDLPAGGYFYVFILEDASTGESVPFKGHITILRE